MINRIFAVYDSKALAYLQPFFSEQAGSAIRAFADASNDSQSPLSKHPGDYQLYEIGTVDNLTGLLTATQPMKLLGCAADFVATKDFARVGDQYVGVASREDSNGAQA